MIDAMVRSAIFFSSDVCVIGLMIRETFSNRQRAKNFPVGAAGIKLSE